MKFAVRVSVMAVICGLGLAPLAANATVDNTVASFTSIVASQGPGVPASRSILGNMFDGDLSTVFSLGIGGNIQFEISPVTDMITSGSTIELSYKGFPTDEAAKIYLGNNLGSYTYIGELFNAYEGGGVTNADPGIALLVSNGAVFSGNATSYSLSVLSGAFNSIELVDDSNAQNSGDGFDIAEFSVTTAPTRAPEPSTVALFGAGLVGAGAFRRVIRKR